MKRHAVPLLVLGLAPLVMLWPLPLHLGGAVVRHYFDHDALLTADNLRGLAENLAHGRLGAGLWDGRFFWPVPGVLSFTEPDLVPAVLVAPLELAGAWLAAYNLALLAGYAVTAWATYALFLDLTAWAAPRDPGAPEPPGDRAAATVLAFAATWCAFRWAHVDHLNYVFQPFPPLLLLGLTRFLRRRRSADALLFAAAGLGEALTCLYDTFFLAACLPAVALAALAFRELRPRPREAARALVPVALAAGLAALLMWPYARLHAAQGVRRDLAEVVTQSGEFQQLAMADMNTLLGAVLPDRIKWDTANFPGALAALAALALAAACLWRRRRPPAAFALALVFAAAAFAVFMGPYFKLDLRPRFRLPFYWLWTQVPGFDGIRAVRRAAGLFELGVAAAGAVGLAALAQGRARRPVLAAAAALAAAECWGAPVPLREVALPGGPALRWLAAHPDGGPVVDLPPRPPGFDNLGVRARLAVRVHGHPALDGHSGFEPAFFEWWRYELLRGDLEPLFSSGARWALVHAGRPGAAQLESQLAAGGRAREVPGVPGLWELPPPAPLAAAPVPAGLAPVPLDGATLEPDGAAALDGDLATRAGTDRPMRPGDAFVLTLPAPRALAALSFTPGPSTLDFPRGLEVDRAVDSRWVKAGAVAAPLSDLARTPAAQPVAVPLDGLPARRYRVVELGASALDWWSIAEVRAWERR